MSEQPPYDVKKIIELIPHRYPFLLIDRVLAVDVEKGTIRAQKNVTINEAFFQGHFPGTPIMPGVLILEAMAQAGGVLVRLHSRIEKIAVLLNVREAKFRRPVYPGDVMILECQGIHFSGKGGRVKAHARVDDKIAAEAEVSFALVDKEQI